MKRMKSSRRYSAGTSMSLVGSWFTRQPSHRIIRLTANRMRWVFFRGDSFVSKYHLSWIIKTSCGINKSVLAIWSRASCRTEWQSCSLVFPIPFEPINSTIAVGSRVLRHIWEVLDLFLAAFGCHISCLKASKNWFVTQDMTRSNKADSGFRMCSRATWKTLCVRSLHLWLLRQPCTQLVPLHFHPH